MSFVLARFHYLVYPFEILVYLKLTKHLILFTADFYPQ